MTGKSYAPTVKPSDTLIIHCADHRFQEAFTKFIAEELRIEVYNPIVIAGGAFAVSSEHYSRFGYIWDQIDFFVTMAGIKRVVLINHEDCLWYRNEFPDLGMLDLKEKGKTDLAQAANNIKEKYPDIEVSAYWAELCGRSIWYQKMV